MTDPAPAPQRRTRPTVLVVEDDSTLRSYLRFLLEREGFRPELLADGRAALARLGEPAPAAVLLDIRLPFVDGGQVLAEIRANAAWRGVPVVMLTSVSAEETIDKFLSAGADDFVTKPFQAGELMARVRRHLRPKA